MIAAGDLRERVQLLSAAATSNSVGEDVVVWSAQATVWAARASLSLRDINRSAGVQGGADAKFVIRARADITTAWQLEHRGTHYAIQAIDYSADQTSMTLLARRA